MYTWKHQLSLKKKRILRIFTSLIIQYQLSSCGSLSLVYYKFSEAPILLFETEDTENVSIADYSQTVMNKWFFFYSQIGFSAGDWLGVHLILELNPLTPITNLLFSLLSTMQFL